MSREVGLKRELSKHQETLSPIGLWGVLASQRATTGRKKINKSNPQIMGLITTSRGEVAQTLASATSKWGLNGQERAALPRVRTGPECPEGNLRS